MKKKKEETIVLKKKTTLFEHLENLTNNKKMLDVTNPEEVSSYDPYIINRFVSMCEMYLPLINEVNQYQIPKDVHYRYLFSTLPKRKQFFKYLKKKKDVDKDAKEKIAKYFECSFREAEIYAEILQEEQIKEIEKKFENGRQ